MSPHHEAWINHHKVDSDWFAEVISMGFEVHHIDGNHDNNEPGNLLLIYFGDHNKIHGMPPDHRKKFRTYSDWGLIKKEREERLEKGRVAYKLRERLLPWKNIVQQTGNKSAINHAEKYAKRNNLTWPLRVPRSKLKTYKKKPKPQQLTDIESIIRKYLSFDYLSEEQKIKINNDIQRFRNGELTANKLRICLFYCKSHRLPYNNNEARNLGIGYKDYEILKKELKNM